MRPTSTTTWAVIGIAAVTLTLALGAAWLVLTVAEVLTGGAE